MSCPLSSTPPPAFSPPRPKVMLSVCTITCKCLPADVDLRVAALELLKPVLELLQHSVSLVPPVSAQQLPPPPPPPGAAPAKWGKGVGGAVMRYAPYMAPLLDRLSTVLAGFASRPDVVAVLLGACVYIGGMHMPHVTSPFPVCIFTLPIWPTLPRCLLEGD